MFANRAPRAGLACTLIAGGAVLLCAGACAPAAPRGDVLRAALERETHALAADTASDPLARELRAAARPAVDRAHAALDAGRRRLALFELARAMPLLGAARHVAERPGAAHSIEALEVEWRRMDAALAPAPRAGDGLRPRVRAALPGALAEAALPQVRIYYDASLEYGRSTAPASGLFYLGQAAAQQAFVALADSLDERVPRRAPAFRSLAGELDDLEREILSAYRPPASIEAHPRFIAAAAALKEARELDALGFHRGAMLRYLQGALRAWPLVGAPPAFDPVATPAALDSLEVLLARDGADHGIAGLFVELARADVEDTTADARHETAAAVAEVVVPRYLAALEPARPRSPAPAPAVTVTLVRWPYT